MAYDYHDKSSSEQHYPTGAFDDSVNAVLLGGLTDSDLAAPLPPSSGAAPPSLTSQWSVLPQASSGGSAYASYSKPRGRNPGGMLWDAAKGQWLRLAEEGGGEDSRPLRVASPDPDGYTTTWKALRDIAKQRWLNVGAVWLPLFCLPMNKNQLTPPPRAPPCFSSQACRDFLHPPQPLLRRDPSPHRQHSSPPSPSQRVHLHNHDRLRELPVD